MKKIGIAIVTIIVLALGAIIMYNQTISGEYIPADDEIVLNIQLNTKEDIGLLIYDYCANGHQYSGGMSNADRSLLKRDDRLVVVWDKQAITGKTVIAVSDARRTEKRTLFLVHTKELVYQAYSCFCEL